MKKRDGLVGWGGGELIEEHGEVPPSLPEAIIENKRPSSGCQVAAVLPGECQGPWGRPF
ncbi:hypothetical protein Cadr_000017055 [Camelus dromedarius]|uniref:Uncharacterized protein n=1 Tax=Camelus dromedarius TaxID=9838 RepID=A0A5N4DED3_CAMDR|nr:hypothetical protein Cadr_000017055 [Camelus dromedarius]